MEEDGKFRGFCIDILDEIANRMNFRYELYRVADNQYGSEDENGSWNGMIRELMEKVSFLNNLIYKSFFINLISISFLIIRKLTLLFQPLQ